MTTATFDAGARLDRAFDTFAAVCIAVRVPFKSEAGFESWMRNSGIYSEQSESDDTHVTYYIRPNYADWLVESVIHVGCQWGTVALPETERGRQLASRLHSRLLNSETGKNLVRNRAFGD